MVNQTNVNIGTRKYFCSSSGKQCIFKQNSIFLLLDTAANWIQKVVHLFLGICEAYYTDIIIIEVYQNITYSTFSLSLSKLMCSFSNFHVLSYTFAHVFSQSFMYFSISFCILYIFSTLLIVVITCAHVVHIFSAFNTTSQHFVNFSYMWTFFHTQHTNSLVIHYLILS